MYFDGPTALYKMVEDRMYSFLDVNKVSTLGSNKKAILILTSCYPESDLKKVADTLEKNLKTIGFEMLDVITYCDNYGKDPVSKNQELVHRAKSLGRTMRNTPTV